MKHVQPAKLAIVAAGLTQTGVARALNYRLQTLNAALNGEIRASGPLRAKLAAYLGMPESALFDDDEAVPAQARELAKESRERQGLPPFIDDPAVLAAVANLVAAAGQAACHKKAS
jgi:transcriptional regulator with XRE-family HTH domain